MTTSTPPVSSHLGAHGADQTPQRAGPVRRFLGLPAAAVVGLAALGLPRVVLHDFGVLTGGSVVAFLLAVLPLVAWVVVATRPRVRAPFLALVATGAVHGVLLAATHQLLWTRAFDGATPRLGDNLADLDPELQDVVLRGAAVFSGMHTGLALGVLTGAVAWAIVRRRRRLAALPSSR